MTRNLAIPWSQSVKTRTTGGTTSILGHIIPRTASEVHGTGAGTTIHGTGTHGHTRLGITADIGEGGTTHGIGIHGTGEDGMILGTTAMPDIGEVIGDGLITITTIIIMQGGMEDGILTGGTDTDTTAAATTERTDITAQGMKQSETNAYLQASLLQGEVWVQAAVPAEA